MAQEQDVRWLQRFENFKKAYRQLDSGIALSASRELSDLEKQGLIQAFEYTYELAWNVLRDYLRWQGNADIVGSRDAIREAFASSLIEDGEGWMRMLKDRNRTSHTYNEETAREILNNIVGSYRALFESLQNRMNGEAEKHGLA
ncbi:nucleotidyltransferase [Marinobacter salinexigens]|uniref:Nucleotidyltransferase n=1 Tax=Marinobacter salinexigens TaxID=2919747 RepID=A0A5B0VKT7_9GAMM|nr:nucleotidyltransferase substrate binding protein [Marinobacter salinexigens]KAA1174725.1 nucleotidyltransferase [Marinobacter salinexigens]